MTHKAQSVSLRDLTAIIAQYHIKCTAVTPFANGVTPLASASPCAAGSGAPSQTSFRTVTVSASGGTGNV